MIDAMRGLGLKGMAGAFDDAVTTGVQRKRTAMEILTDLLRAEGAHRHALVLVGGTGTGKTHLASAIAASVIRAGARGRYFNTVDLVTQLEEETRIGKAGALAAQLRRHELVVFDELGYLPFARSGASCCST